ncbi:MAG: NifU family protein [Rubrobacter sp.]|nr:NifU family protein [Rubrobacter sp.]
MLLDDQELRGRVARIETLLEEIACLKDPNARAKAAEMVQVLLELYGEGLARMMEVIAQGQESERTFGVFAEDELISHLLLLHGLHPVDVETRILQALEEVRPYLQSHGGNVELLGVEGGVARLRMQGSCDGCPSSAATLKLAIEEAVQKAAPDLEGVEAEGVAEPPPKPTTTFVAAPTLRKKEKKLEEGKASWAAVGGLSQLSGGGMLVKEISGEPVLFVKLEDGFYAYRHVCPGCRESMEQGALKGAGLSCPGCKRRYEVRRAGRCLDDPQLHLEPIPLLMSEEGIVKIALASAVG